MGKAGRKETAQVRLQLFPEFCPHERGLRGHGIASKQDLTDASWAAPGRSTSPHPGTRAGRRAASPARRDLARPGTSPQGAPRRVHRRRGQGCGAAANRCAAGPGPSRQVERGQQVSVSRLLSPINFGRSSAWLHKRRPARAPSWRSGHLVQALEAGAHLSQPTSGEGGPQAPPPPPTPKPSPGAPTLVYLGGSIPGSAQGGGVTRRATAHRGSRPRGAEGTSFV